MATYQCPGCGANVPDESAAATIKCPYCGTTITKEQSTVDKVINLVKDPINKYQEKKAKEEAEEERKRKEELAKPWIKRSGSVFLIISVLLLALYFGGSYITHIKQSQEMSELVTKVESLYLEGKYDEALLYAEKIRVVDKWSDNETKKWDDQREALIKRIEEAKSTK